MTSDCTKDLAKHFPKLDGEGLLLIIDGLESLLRKSPLMSHFST